MNQNQATDKDIKTLIENILNESSDGDYIYRGEVKEFAKISSTLYRQYEKRTNAENFDIEIAQKEMLKQVKKYTDFEKDIDILTELQHYGGKTNLIDFTTDYLIALFFACDGEYNESGRIILLNKKTNHEKI